MSLTLFILAAEVLTRGLSSLHAKPGYRGYELPKWSTPINHLAYIDDTILFTTVEEKPLMIMIKVLRKYEEVSCQLINLNKSVFYVHEKTAPSIVSRIRQISRIRRGIFRIIYLECPIFYSRNKISYYDFMIKKIINIIQSWQEKMLSFGGGQFLLLICYIVCHCI